MLLLHIINFVQFQIDFYIRLNASFKNYPFEKYNKISSLLIILIEEDEVSPAFH